MFIMMYHNDSTDEIVLRILFVTRLYWIDCCCYKHMVMQQVNELNEKKVRNLNAGNITTRNNQLAVLYKVRKSNS